MLIRGFEAAVVANNIRKLSLSGDSGKTKQFAFFGNGRAVSLREGSLQGRLTLWIASRCCSMFGIRYSLMTLPESIVSIRVKNNIRLNYRTGAGVIRPVKIALPSLFRSGNLSREVAARNILSKMNSKVLVPEIGTYDQSGLEWFEEQYVDHKFSTKSYRIRTFLRLHATNLYKPSARPRPLEQMLRIWDIDASNLQHIFHEAGANEVVDTSKTWPLALIHGDLNPGNMVLDKENKLFLVDLEKTGRGPVAWDLRKLCLTEPGLVIGVLKSLQCASDLKPEIQMKVALSVQLIQERRLTTALNDYESKHLSRSDMKIAKKRARRERALLSMIGSDF